MNDGFLQKVAFPAFEAGVLDANSGVELLLDQVRDNSTRVPLELLVESGLEGSFFGLDSERWVDSVYRLIFLKWVQKADGWHVAGEYVGYAGDWHETLHLALMLEHPRYPYWDAKEAAAVREACIDAPYTDLGLAALLCGLWDPFPPFPPDQVISTVGRGAYNPGEQAAVADWCHRSAAAVVHWDQQVAAKLSRLLRREEMRLRPAGDAGVQGHPRLLAGPRRQPARPLRGLLRPRPARRGVGARHRLSGAAAPFGRRGEAGPHHHRHRGGPAGPRLTRQLRESSRMVTGPSFTSATFMSAANTPSPTVRPAARSAAHVLRGRAPSRPRARRRR